MRMRHALLILPGILLAALTACQGGNRNEIVLSGTIEAESVHAGSRIGGRVAEVMADEGLSVKEGDVLFVLETEVLEAERERAEAMVRETEAAYAVLAAGAKEEDVARMRHEAEALRQAWELAQAGPLPEELASLENQAQSLEAVYRNLQDAADRLASLYAEGAVAEREYIAAREAAEAARSQWTAALDQLDAMRSRPRVEEVAAARARYYAAANAVRSLEIGATPEQLEQGLARITTAGKALDRLDLDIAEATVRAPSAGVISSFDLSPGDFVAPGQAACEIVGMERLKLVVYIPENRLGFVTEGEELAVRVDSFPGETFSGVVLNVAPQAEFTPRNVQVVDERVSQVFAVELSLSNPDGRLRPGMAADVTVPLSG